MPDPGLGTPGFHPMERPEPRELSDTEKEQRSRELNRVLLIEQPLNDDGMYFHFLGRDESKYYGQPSFDDKNITYFAYNQPLLLLAYINNPAHRDQLLPYLIVETDSTPSDTVQQLLKETAAKLDDKLTGDTGQIRSIQQLTRAEYVNWLRDHDLVQGAMIDLPERQRFTGEDIFFSGIDIWKKISPKIFEYPTVTVKPSWVNSSNALRQSLGFKWHYVPVATKQGQRLLGINSFMQYGGQSMMSLTKPGELSAELVLEGANARASDADRVVREIRTNWPARLRRYFDLSGSSEIVLRERDIRVEEETTGFYY